MVINCLIVDDEELALNVLEKYISTLPSLRLAGKCENALDAITFLHKNQVDLLFLDLNMPELGGLDMLKTLSDPPLVILTTAYSEFALESYEFGVVDYLLKPIKLERFIKAVNKAVGLLRSYQPAGQESNTDKSGSIFVKEDHITYQISWEHILYIEAYGNYLKVYTTDKTYVTRDTMMHVEELLSESQFLRVHKSFLVNLSKVSRMAGNVLYIGETELPVGTTYKNQLVSRLNK